MHQSKAIWSSCDKIRVQETLDVIFSFVVYIIVYFWDNVRFLGTLSIILWSIIFFLFAKKIIFILIHFSREFPSFQYFSPFFLANAAKTIERWTLNTKMWRKLGEIPDCFWEKMKFVSTDKQEGSRFVVVRYLSSKLANSKSCARPTKNPIVTIFNKNSHQLPQISKIKLYQSQ